MSRFLSTAAWRTSVPIFTRTPQQKFLLAGTLRKMSTADYEHILTSKPEPTVSLITLNRPRALNALCSPLFVELNDALRKADEDPEVGAIVLTGSERAFAAGADIKEMKDKECEFVSPLICFRDIYNCTSVSDVYKNNFLENWATMTKIRKPIIAAVSGFAVCIAFRSSPSLRN